MCNLYSMTTPQAAMRDAFADQGVDDRLGNLAELPEIWPDQAAPVLRRSRVGTILQPARWGLPTPEIYLKGKRTDRGVTNLRNTESAHWRRWMGPPHRALVPFTRFAEPEALPGGGFRNRWFRPADGGVACFAGVFVPGWTSTRRLAEGETTNDLFAFLTTGANALVATVHPKAMPVVLRDPRQWDLWLHAPWEEARALQRPADDDDLVIEE